MVTCSDEVEGRYNIFDPPLDGTVWLAMDGQTNTEYLSKAGKSVRFWVVGEVHPEGARLVDDNGYPLNDVWLRMRPVRDGEYNEWRRFLDHLGGPIDNSEFHAT